MKLGYARLAVFVALIVVAPTLRAGDAVGDELIVNRYLTASREQQTALRGVTMEVDIDATIPKLKKQGKLHALRKISIVGKVTYRMLGFDGDSSVKKDVIARYLSAELQSQNGSNLAITPENYKFKFKGRQVKDGNSVYVLALTPRRKEAGLFKGELWLDAETCMPVREAGRFVKSPSIFLSRMEFIRTYELHDGVAVPSRIESRVETRFFGPVQLNVGYTNYARTPDDDTVSSVGSPEIQN